MSQADFFIFFQPQLVAPCQVPHQPSGAGFAGRGLRSRYTANCSIRVLTKLQFSILRTHPKKTRNILVDCFQDFRVEMLWCFGCFFGVSNLTQKKSHLDLPPPLSQEASSVAAPGHLLPRRWCTTALMSWVAGRKGCWGLAPARFAMKEWIDMIQNGR